MELSLVEIKRMNAGYCADLLAPRTNRTTTKRIERILITIKVVNPLTSNWL